VFSPQSIQGEFNLESVLISHNVSKNVFKCVMESGNYGQIPRLKFGFIFCIQSQIKAIMFDDRLAAWEVSSNAFLTEKFAFTPYTITWINVHISCLLTELELQSWRIASVNDCDMENRLIKVVFSSQQLIFNLYGDFCNVNVSSYLCLTNTRRIASYIVHLYDGLLQATSLYPKNAGLQKPREYKATREYDEPPVGRRLVLSAIGILGGFGIALRGGNYLDDKRVALGVLLTAIGFAFLIVGFCLWWLLNFQSTWGWWV